MIVGSELRVTWLVLWNSGMVGWGVLEWNGQWMMERKSKRTEAKLSTVV